MSLSFAFQLTPRQTQFLIKIAYGHYRACGQEGAEYLVPDFDSPLFVTIGQALIKKGLVSHDGDRSPTWLVTDRGKVLADMIADDASSIVALRDSKKTVPVKYGKKKAVRS